MQVCGNRRNLIREGRSAKAWMEFARRRAAAAALMALDDDRAQFRPREQRGRGQAIRARADDGNIVAHARPLLLPPRTLPRAVSVGAEQAARREDHDERERRERVPPSPPFVNFPPRTEYRRPRFSP